MPKPIFDHFLGTGYFASSHQMASATLRKLLSVLSAISSKKKNENEFFNNENEHVPELVIL